MTTKELQERINKVTETIAKKENIIVKRNKSIEKRFAQLHKIGYTSNTLEGILNELDDEFNKNGHSEKRNEGYDIYCDLESDYSSIEDATKAIEDEKAKLAKYQEMLKKEEGKNDFIATLPENVIAFMNELEATWNKQDKYTRDLCKEMYRECYNMDYWSQEYKEWKATMQKKFGLRYHDMMQRTDEEIEKTNKKAVESLILDFIKRVELVAGTITSFKNLHLSRNNQGFAILNGSVEGTNGNAKVESILAGGYNIQRLHIRVLVK